MQWISSWTLPIALLKKLGRLKKKAFRDAYVQGNIEHGIAHQIRTLRQQRDWSQAELAQRFGARGQSTVARWEDPSYGKYTLNTLVKLASVFDVGLSVRFVSFGRILAETQDLSPTALQVKSFSEELPSLQKELLAASSNNFISVTSSSNQPEPIGVALRSDTAGFRIDLPSAHTIGATLWRP